MIVAYHLSLDKAVFFTLEFRRLSKVFNFYPRAHPELVEGFL